MKKAKKLALMINKAQKGGWSLWKLNFVMGIAIPFNEQHGFRVLQVTEDSIKTVAPYQRRNFNHIRGIHACGIATIAEFATGLALLRRVDASQYRIIMSKMEVQYFYQAKMKLVATATASQHDIQTTILEPLNGADSVFKTMEAKIEDVSGNHIATAMITWQFKRWDKVKTRA
jgi:acyl-coenzyme A thioesterase PaaI-like protein